MALNIRHKTEDNHCLVVECRGHIKGTRCLYFSGVEIGSSTNDQTAGASSIIPFSIPLIRRPTDTTTVSPGKESRIRMLDSSRFLFSFSSFTLFFSLFPLLACLFERSTSPGVSLYLGGPPISNFWFTHSKQTRKPVAFSISRKRHPQPIF